MHQFPIHDTNDNSPPSYENWRCYAGKNSCSSINEVRIYTDAHITGEIEIGPYKFMNTLAGSKGDKQLRPAIVLRSHFHWPPFQGLKPYSATSADHYHGGDHSDEIAALLSLNLGARAMAGNVCREFRGGGDELGTPIELGYKPEPFLIPSSQMVQIERLYQSKNLSELQAMEGIFYNEQAAFNSIIKSARLYQQAIWIAESQPDLSWLLLVSAIEAAANFWGQGKPEGEDELDSTLEKLLKECSEDKRKQMIAYMRKYTKSTKKFVEFLVEFLPSPPSLRPQLGLLDFDNKDELRRGFKAIYGYRSEALHGGIAFPAPLCMPPGQGEEKPLCLGVRTGGVQWWFKDTPMPMLLHMFEYIARGAILNWIKSL